MVNIRAKLEKSIEQRGLAGTVKLSLFNVYYYGSKLTPRALYRARHERTFDRMYGVDTTGRIDLSDLGDVTGVAADHGTRYEPSCPEVFHRMMGTVRQHGIDVEKLTFVDYGSGKGRTLLLASDYPFQKIHGIEISEKLHRVAVRNLEVYKSPAQRCTALSSEIADALEWAPPNEPTMFYLYHPFRAPLLEGVLDRIGRSLADQPREAWILYVGRLYEEVMESRSFLEPIVWNKGPPMHGIWRVHTRTIQRLFPL